ncbi:hypothetical protein F5144DRAFT_255266 [Chaetomium tenue]|uniref:Uncharacterized protein n=1 Tax=Chaetomium tenue TaxID=1854479 RepID=A0ACB7PAT5_9PEZI|nr:hypothetical protein F5144DRAFT_255266 [Chaetomium globosum]
MSTCEPLQGNSDFYGLGIRIGIYLQWGSSWLSMLLDPESAQGVLDANSIFVFAVVIATIIAATNNAPAIEMYIMLQILLGFPITSLSAFGLRIWLMSPRRLDSLRTRITQRSREDREKRRQVRQQNDERQRQKIEARNEAIEEWQRERVRRRAARNLPWWLNWASDAFEVLHYFMTFKPPRLPDVGVPGGTRQDLASQLPPPFDGLYTLWHFPVQLPLNIFSPLKFPGLSWSGVVWRTTIIALIIGYNLAYWFDENGHGVFEPPTPGCGPPVVFLFSKQLLHGAIISLGRAVAVIAVVVVGPPACTLLMLTLRVHVYAILFLYRDVYFYFASSPMGQTLQTALDRVNQVLQHKAVPVLQSLEAYTRYLPATAITTTAVMSSALDLFEFMTTFKADNIRFSDVIKVGVSLGLGKPVRHSPAQQGQRPMSRAETMLTGWRNKTPTRLTGFCIAWNIGVILSIAWFIVSIETTISWNNIQGVNNIDSTGQLIPFIIGCVSASHALKKVLLLALGKKYPDWANTHLEVQDDKDGPVIFRIVKQPASNPDCSPNDDAEGGQPKGDSSGGGGTQEHGIMLADV